MEMRRPGHCPTHPHTSLSLTPMVEWRDLPLPAIPWC